LKMRTLLESRLLSDVRVPSPHPAVFEFHRTSELVLIYTMFTLFDFFFSNIKTRLSVSSAQISFFK
jgi:hypothetical protein